MQRAGFIASKWLIIATAVLELALSQIHIKAITNVFAQQIGFYLFLFILFGLLLIFIMFSVKALDKSEMFKMSLPAFAACATGFYTAWLIWGDCKTNETISFPDIRLSFLLLVGGSIVYAGAIIVILINSVLDRKGESHEKNFYRQAD